MALELIYYSLSVSFSQCSVQITCNGFPVVRAQAASVLHYQYPVNEYLVGTGNILEVSIMPAPERGILTVTNAQARVTLKTFQKGQIVTPEDGELVELTGQTDPQLDRIVKSIDLTDFVSRVRDPRGPVKASFKFDNRVHNFSQLFRDAPPIGNPDEVREYGMRIYGYFERRDMNQIIEEMSVKIRDLGKANFEAEQAERALAAKMLQEYYFTPGLAHRTGQPDLAAVPWCEKRIYEVVVKPDRPLILTKADTKGSFSELRIFVARINGKLRVVR